MFSVTKMTKRASWPLVCDCDVWFDASDICGGPRLQCLVKHECMVWVSLQIVSIKCQSLCVVLSVFVSQRGHSNRIWTRLFLITATDQRSGRDPCEKTTFFLGQIRELLDWFLILIHAYLCINLSRPCPLRGFTRLLIIFSHVATD